MTQVDYPRELVGAGYEDFWSFTGRYRAVKGSRASKKSKTMALWLIIHMMRYPMANALVVRKVYRTLKDSCFAELLWAVERLGVAQDWQWKISPLELTYAPTGQKIYFRGLDDAQKTASIAVQSGALCWLWVEEAYEIMKEEDFAMLDESIRGELPDGLFKQVTLTFNPWSERHWLKKRFFDEPHADVLAKTVTYMGNEWLDAADKAFFEAMRVNNPRRYRVAGLGDWGIAEGLIYENWQEFAFEPDTPQLLRAAPVFGLDFGYTHDPSALFCGLADTHAMQLYVFDELYERALTNKMIYERILRMGYAKEKIRADSAEPKSIDELREMGLPRIRPARKGHDSVRNGIQRLQDYTILVHPKCVHFITEISAYTFRSDRFGNKLNEPEDKDNHLMDAMRYAMEEVAGAAVYSFR